jgi:hypothetical protein
MEGDNTEDRNVDGRLILQLDLRVRGSGDLD